MNHLTKKQRKYVSRAITKKLEAMGVKDEVTFVGSGKIRKFFKKDEKCNLILETDKDGKKVPKQFDVEMPLALNVMRRTVRELRNQTPEVINAFLRMEVPGKE